MALMGILAACTGDDRLTPDDGGAESVSVRIVLSTGGGTGNGPFTRVTPTAPGAGTPSLSMEEGEAYDYYINPYDAQVLLFTAETTGNDGGEFVGRASFTDVWPLAGETGKYHLSGILEGVTEEDLGQAYQVVVLCNTGGTLTPWMDGVAYSKESSLADISRNELIGGLTYSGYTAAFTGALTDPSATAQERAARIPMWGIEPLPGLKKENSLQIDVLRTMAKVRIKFDASDCTLNSVTLNRAHTGGYMAAQGGQAIDASGGTNHNDDTSTTGIQSPSIPTEAGVITTGLTFTQVTGAGKKAYVIYIPEYKNIATSESETVTPAYMTLNITGNGTTQDYTLHFAEYTSDSDENPTAPEWDIIRNDIYDYTITSITPTGGLKANVRVMPWEHETMGYELTQDPVVTIGWSEGWPVCYDGINYGVPTCYENEYYYATFYVDVSIPEGVKWQAHLTNPLDFEFDPAYSDHGYAHINENDGYTDYYGNKTDRVTVKVRPKSACNAGVRRTTNLYFTLETLVGGNKKATIKWWADNPDTDDYIEGNGPFPMLGDTNDPPGEGKMVRIVQIAESEWEGYRSNLLNEWKKEQAGVQQAVAAEE